MLTSRDNEFTDRPDLVRKKAQAILLRRTLITVGLIFLFVSLAINTVDAIASFQTRAEVIDCTNPDGECAKRGQENQAKAIEAILLAGQERETVTREIIIAAASCAERLREANVIELERCVEEELKK